MGFRRRLLSLFALAPVVALVAACSTPDLTPEGARVTLSRNAPPAGCQEIKHLVGHGGGTFGGEYIANDDLIEYAMNDLRNEAAEVGANYVQHDTPTLGGGSGTTTTATVSGTAFRCPDPAP
ncbi:MAG: DUF4156 domain-containing protein [Labilithrix sp.]|nr:DUF4156 domain-containing protein [Labilithrix sp.]